MKSKLITTTQLILIYISNTTRFINRNFTGLYVYDNFIKVISKLKIDVYFVRLFLNLGASPILTAKMSNNTNIKIDLRSGTEFRSFFSSEYDSFFINIIHDLIDENDYFLDIGANIGFYSVSVASKIRDLFGTGKVISFEPFLGNYDRLLENINLNNLESFCVPYHIGLSNFNSNGIITLREDFVNGSKTGTASISINPLIDTGFQTSSIELETLDFFWDKFNDKSKRIGFIKMDIEGHEDLCLKGAQKVINKDRPTILMEINKPFLKARGINLDDTFLPLIPKNYFIFVNNKRSWSYLKTFDQCREVDNVFLIPKELINLNKFQNFKV